MIWIAKIDRLRNKNKKKQIINKSNNDNLTFWAEIDV